MKIQEKLVEGYDGFPSASTKGSAKNEKFGVRLVVSYSNSRTTNPSANHTLPPLT